MVRTRKRGKLKKRGGMNGNFFPPVSPEPKGRALWDNRQITNKLEKQLLAYLTQNASKESETNIDNLKEELEKLKNLLESKAINKLVTYSNLDKVFKLLKEASDKIDKIYDRLNKQNEELIEQIKKISIHYRILKNDNSIGGTKFFEYLYKILQELTKDKTAEIYKNLKTQMLDELTKSLNKEREQLKNLIGKIKKNLEELIGEIKEIKEILEESIEPNSNKANNKLNKKFSFESYSNEEIKKIKKIKESKKVVANDVVKLLEILEELKGQIKDKDENFKNVWAIARPANFSATPFDSSDPRYINFPDWLKEKNSGEPLKKEYKSYNNEFPGFGFEKENENNENNEFPGFEGGARRTKKRRRSNKAKLARRPQNRVCQRRTSKKRSKN